MKYIVWLIAGHIILFTGACLEAYVGVHFNGTGYSLVGIATGFCYGMAFSE